ncbi:MAG: hypothetical protein ACE5E6_08315 [Phycisphaerae bacterium]
MLSSVEPTTLLVRWVHIGAAMATVGGAAYMRLAVLPALRDGADDPARARLREALTARWARVVHVCIALLLVTGFGNFYLLAIRPHLPAMPYHPVFGAKLLTAVLIFFIASALVSRGPGFAGIRAKSATWLTILLIAAAVVVALSGVLVQLRGG